MSFKRICPIHGIYTKDTKKGGCPKCVKNSNSRYDKESRDKENDEFYHSREWKRVKGLKLSRQPFCEVCNHPAVIVDHIIEIKDGGAKLSLSNLQSLCISCHNTKTSNESKVRGGAIKSLQTVAPNTELPSHISQSPISRGGLDA